MLTLETPANIFIAPKVNDDLLRQTRGEEGGGKARVHGAGLGVTGACLRGSVTGRGRGIGVRVREGKKGGACLP